MKQKLEDTSKLILSTGGILGKAVFKCRKIDFFGDCGDVYFEQPSINLIESGLWSEKTLRPRLFRVEIVSTAPENKIDAIRFTYCEQTGRTSAGGGKTLTLARQWIGDQK